MVIHECDLDVTMVVVAPKKIISFFSKNHNKFKEKEKKKKRKRKEKSSFWCREYEL
jgi:hypothetical protein